MADWTQQVALITGGARGLGRGFAEALLGRGAKVYFVDVNPVTGSETYQELKTRFSEDKVRFSVADVTNRQQFKEAFDSAVSIFGHVDIMINNAGILNEKKYDLEISVNFSAVVYGTYLALEHMRRDRGGRGGRIVNVSSAAGLDDIYALPVYGATKHAVRAFTSALSKQPNIADMAVQFAVLCPGVTETDIVLNVDFSIYFCEIDLDQFKTVRMPVARVSQALLALLESDSMNGAILLVDHTGTSYRKLENVLAQ